MKELFQMNSIKIVFSYSTSLKMSILINIRFFFNYWRSPNRIKWQHEVKIKFDFISQLFNSTFISEFIEFMYVSIQHFYFIELACCLLHIWLLLLFLLLFTTLVCCNINANIIRDRKFVFCFATSWLLPCCLLYLLKYNCKIRSMWLHLYLCIYTYVYLGFNWNGNALNEWR